MRACSGAESSGKQRLTLTFTICRRPACSMYKSIPSAPPKAAISGSGNQLTARMKPRPIHVGHQRGCRKRLRLASAIGLWRVARAGLEDLEGPQVLLGHVPQALLDDLIHARGIARAIAVREILQRRFENHLIAASAGEQARETRNDQRIGQARQPTERGECRGRHAEERHEYRLALAKILVRQIVKREPLLEPADHGTQALLARQQETAEAHAS